MIIRRARMADVDAMLRVKHGLRLDPAAGAVQGGGFLLGASAEAYAWFVEHAQVLVLEDPEHGVGGFAVALPDAVLRTTDVWVRRRSIAWKGASWDALEDARVAYFDQLAVRPDRRFRMYVAALAVAALVGIVESGHEHLFATVVREPVRNLASLPLLNGLGARPVGQIEEEYPGVGRLLSEVYHARVGRGTPAALFASSALARRVERMVARATAGLALPAGSHRSAPC